MKKREASPLAQRMIKTTQAAAVAVFWRASRSIPASRRRPELTADATDDERSAPMVWVDACIKSSCVVVDLRDSMVPSRAQRPRQADASIHCIGMQWDRKPGAPVVDGQAQGEMVPEPESAIVVALYRHGPDRKVGPLRKLASHKAMHELFGDIHATQSVECPRCGRTV